jgi:hypothetical protein
MKIHGIRIYPDIQTVQTPAGEGLRHGTLDEKESEFFFLFRHLAPLLTDSLVGRDFTIELDRRGRRIDATAALESTYGPDLAHVDGENQICLLRGSGFRIWAKNIHLYESAILPIFSTQPPPDVLRRVFWPRDGKDVSSRSWPREMTGLIHLWDDVCWQFFSVRRAGVNAIIRAHGRDERIRIYDIDLDLEFPDPRTMPQQLSKAVPRPDD